MESEKSNGLQVIGVGWYRNSTLSLKVALEKLGYNKCYHMFEFFERPADEELWNPLIEGKDTDYDKLFDGYQAAVDTPATIFTFELLKKYPNAKVILNQRDPKKWYESAKNTIYAQGEKWQALYPHCKKVVHHHFNTQLEGKIFDEEYMIKRYTQHYEEVRKIVPENQRIEFEASQGWEPLCKFLGKEIPNEPFPRLNDSKTIVENLDKGVIEI